MRLLLLLCGWLLSAPVMAGAPIVAAASSLQFALEEAAQQFTQQTGQALRLNFGSSGNFRRQIAQGAPFELFLSANEGFVQALYDEGYVDSAGVIYARGRLAWVQPAGRYSVPSEQAPLAGVQEAIAALAEGSSGCVSPLLALNTPPYGVAAQEVLQKRVFGKPASRFACRVRTSPKRCSLPCPMKRAAVWWLIR
ncbi:hypothetical protein HAALTHF_20730n [Vreelandella aquamarina]|nr:hypothetical protein HAALTHF_20730n [Halomonas axialensis]